MKIVNTISAVSQQYYIMAEHWASDLEFFKVETIFLRGLLEDHFMELCEQRYIEELKRFGQLLMDLSKGVYECDQSIGLQLAKLSLLTEYSLLDNKEELEESQIEIESRVNTITKEYRNVKMEIFRLIQVLLKDNKFRNRN